MAKINLFAKYQQFVPAARGGGDKSIIFFYVMINS